jgi:cytidylate kinase
MMRFVYIKCAAIVFVCLFLHGCFAPTTMKSCNELEKTTGAKAPLAKGKPVIAIDGPVHSGKDTLAKKLAKHLGYAYISTGSIYRIIGLEGLTPKDIDKMSMRDVMERVKKIPYETLQCDTTGLKASEVAKRADIRASVLRLIREFMADPGDEYGGSVMDGRDIGTVVAPDAVCKLFVTARLDVRAKRGIMLNPNKTYEEVKKMVQDRDHNDQTRKEAPLICDERYEIIDTSNTSEEEVLKIGIKLVNEALAAAARRGK